MKFLYTLFFSLLTLSTYAQENVAVVEKLPQFPGGMEALAKYLGENIKYPEKARKNNTQGRVYIKFVVDKEGNVKDAHVFKGIGDGCEEEAMRVVNSMPKWKPATQRGRPVEVVFTLPVKFKLEKEKKKKRKKK